MKENGFKLNTFVKKLNQRNLMKSEIENYFIKCSPPEISNSHLLQLKLCSTLIEAFANKEDFEFALSNGISFIKRIVKNSLEEIKRKESLKKKVWSSLLLLWEKLKLLIEQDSCSADLTTFTQWLLKNLIDISPFARHFESSFSFNISENLYFIDDHFKDLSLDIVLSLKSIIDPKSRDNTLVYTVSRYILEHFKPSKCVFKFLKLMMVAKVLHCVSKSGRVDATQLLQDFLKKMSIPSDFWKWAEENLNLAIPQKKHLKSSKQLGWILLNINVCTVYKILYGDKYLKRLSKKAEDGNSKINSDNLKESINNAQENEALSDKSLYDEDSKKSFKELADSELLLVKKKKKKRVRSLLRSSETADGGVWIVQQLPERKAGTLETEKFMEKLVQTNGRAYENCNNTTRGKEKRKINENNISKISSGESRKQLKRAHSFEFEEVRKTCSPSTEKRSKDWNIVNKPSYNLCDQKDIFSSQIHPKEFTKRSVSDSSVLRSVQASHEEVEKKRKRKQIKKSKLKIAQNSSVEVIGSSVVNTKNVMCSTKVVVDTKQENKKINVKKVQTEKLKILQSSSSEAVDNLCRDTRTVGGKVELDLKSTNVKVEKKVKNRRRRLKALQNVGGISISVECMKDVASTEEMAVIEPVSILKNKLKNGPSKGLILNKNNESKEEAVTETSRLSEVSVKKMKKTETYRHCEDLETKNKNKIKNRSKALQTNLDLCDTEISFEDVNAATSKVELAEKKPKSILKNKLKTLPSKGLNLRKNSEDEIKAATETFRLKNKAVKKKKKNLLGTETYKNYEDLETEEHQKQSVLSLGLEPRELLGKDHVCIKKRIKDKCLPHMENGKCPLKGSKNIEVEHDKSQEDSHTEFNDAWIIKQCDAKRTSIQEDISATLSDKVLRNVVTDEVGRSNVLNRNFEKETKDKSEVKIAEQIESTKRRKRKREQEKFMTSLSSQSVLKNKKKKEGSELLEKYRLVKEKERTKKRRKTDHTKGKPSSIDNRNRYTICAAGPGGNEILGELNSVSNAKEKTDVSDLEVLEVKEAKYDERLSKKSNKSFDVDEASGNESDIVDCDDHTMFTEEETSNYHQFQLKEMKEEKLRKAKSLLSKMKDPNEETLIVEEEPPVERNNREELCKNTEDITQVLYKKMVHPVSDSAKSLDDYQEEEELPYGSDNDSDLEVIFDTINKDTIENRIKKEMHSNDEREGVSAAPAETAQSSEIFISSVFDLYRSAAKKSKEDVLYCGTIDRSRRDSIEVVEHKHFSVSDDSKNEIFLHCASESLIEENKNEVFDVSHGDLKKTETTSASNASVVIMDEECSSTKENLSEANDAVDLNRDKEETSSDKESPSKVASISSIVDKNECELQSGCRNISEKENVDMTLHSDKSAQEEKADNCELQSRSDEWQTISVSSSKTEKGSEFLEIITLKSKDLDSENESERTEKCRESKESENNASFFQSVREGEGKEALPESLLLDDRVNFDDGSGDVRINSNGGSGDVEILSLSQQLTDFVYDERQKSIARSPHRKALCFDDEKEKIIGESTVLASDRRVSAEHICLLSGADVELESIATGAILLENRTHENKENIMNNWQEEDLNGSSFSAGKDSTVKVKENEQIASIVVMSLRKDTRINSPRSSSKTASKQASLEKSASKMTTLTPLKVANAALKNEIVISPHVSDESASQISNTEIENANIISFIPDDNILSKSCAEEEQEEEEEDKGFDFLSFTRNASPSKMEQSLNQSNFSNSSTFSPLHLSKLSQNQSKLSDSTSRHSLSPSLQNLSTTPSPAKISSRKDTSGLTSGNKQSQFISPSKMQHHLASSEKESPSLHINQSLKLSKNRSLSAERPTTHNSEDNSQLLCASNSKSSLILNNSPSFESPSYAKQSQKLTNSTRRRGSIESPQSSLIKKSPRLCNQSLSLSRNRSPLPVKQLSTYTSEDDFQSPCSSNSRSSLILNSSLSDFQSPCTSNSRSSSLIINSSPSMESPYAKSSQKLANTTRNKGSIESSQSPLIRRSPRLNDNCILKENSESPQSLLIRKSPRLDDNCTTKESIENLQSPLIRESPRLDDKCTTKESIERPQSPLIRKSPRLDANSTMKESIESPQSPLIRKSPRLDDKCITENVTSSGSSKLENDSSPLKESELPNSSEPSLDQTEERDKVDSSLKTRYTLRRRTAVTPVKQVVASPRRRRNSLSAIKDDEETAQMLSSPVRSRSRRNSLSGCETPLTPLRRSRRISGFPEVIAEEK